MSVPQTYPYSVDPNNIPKHLSTKQLEFFLLFAVLVAGKSASQTFKKLNEFMTRIAFGPLDFPTLSPFEIVRFLIEDGSLGAELEASRFGQYKRIVPALERAVSDLDPEDLTLEALEAIPGIGPKTSRFIMLYSDPKFEGVPLDTHILKYLKEKLPKMNVPKSTPPAGERYEFYEKMFQGFARAQGLTVRELDTIVWQSYSMKKEDQRA